MTIDLSASYAKAVREALPEAVLVADKFHLVALGNQMLTEVRQHVTRTARGRRGRTKDPEWAARRKLLLGYERHADEAFTRLWNGLIDAGDPGIEILHAYIVKEQLRRLVALPTSADRELISHRLWQFYRLAAASNIPEAHRLAETVEAWWPSIEAAITTGYTNARSEGYNRLGIKDPSHKHYFVFSILRVFDPTVPTAGVNAAESHFKKSLMTGRFGVNRN